MPRPTSQLREFARVGAEARLKELEAEIASIRRALPELRAERGGEVPISSGKKVRKRRRRRRRMSAEARAKIAAAQRKRWAAVKAGKKR